MKETLLLLSSMFIAFLTFGQNTSINFDGTDDVLTFPLCSALTFRSFTIEGWVKCKHSSADVQVIMMAFQDDIQILNANVTLEVRNNGLLRFNYRANAATLGGYEVYSTTAIDDYKWHHFAAVKYNNERLLLYIDGILEASSAFEMENITATPYFEIGRNKYDGANTFRWLHGSVDDFKIWETARSASQISSNYQKESSGLEPALFSNYKFDVDSDVIYDCSPNLRHGFRAGNNGGNNLPQFSLDIPSLFDVPCSPQASGTEEALLFPEETGKLFIQPNPVSNRLTMIFEKPVSCIIQLVDLKGRVVRTVNYEEKSTEKLMPVQDIPSGNYIIRAILPNLVLMSRIVKI